MVLSCEESMDNIFKKYKEKVPEALNKTFSDRISKTEAIQRHLDRKQLSSTPLFPTYQQQDVLQAKGLDKEKQAASTGPSDPKKTRLCKNCGQPMKGHPKVIVHKNYLTNILSRPTLKY
ncbi:uncharacterized protein LOC124454878 isoform X2 [Xenia sp. Carnegie-2017]|uniref:uncharacterized protein LOC124454878 isoform X2 n=1 Tax=Xenia sp. Carnegie-2017 TaxID=2897299 RepID=UPI001F042B7B|nr:uncharacterized protein LOC124454878 isoform X2 [Xenia sp. Carnegie-2017]